MISQSVTEARHELLIRELLERAALREMCLRALTERSGRDSSETPPAMRLVRHDESRVVR